MNEERVMDGGARLGRIRIVGLYQGREGLQFSLWRHALTFLTRVPGCIAVQYGPENLEMVKAWKPDGVLMHGGGVGLANELLGLGWKVVNTSGTQRGLPVPSVLPDNLAVGRMAGDFMVSKGYRSFAYVGPHAEGSAYSALRLAGFREAAEKAGAEVAVYRGARVSGDIPAPGTLTPFLEWVGALPQGTAVFAADDLIGFNVAEQIRSQDWDLRERIGLITGHDREIPSNPPLTGVKMPEERWGYEAARMLVELVRGEREATGDLLLPPLGVVERESTSGVASDDPFLQEAVRYIRDHAADVISVEDVTKAVALGRRALERRFEELLGRTILQEIHRVKVEHAKSLLIDTDMSVHAVAMESGLSDEKHLRRLMALYAGKTPGAFRRQHRIT